MVWHLGAGKPAGGLWALGKAERLSAWLLRLRPCCASDAAAPACCGVVLKAVGGTRRGSARLLPGRARGRAAATVHLAPRPRSRTHASLLNGNPLLLWPCAGACGAHGSRLNAVSTAAKEPGGALQVGMCTFNALWGSTPC